MNNNEQSTPNTPDPSANDQSGAGAAPGSTSSGELALQAAQSALGNPTGELPKKIGRPIKSGKWVGQKKKRKPDGLPMVPMDNGTGSPLLEESHSQDFPVAAPEIPEEPFDEEAAKEGASMIADCMEMVNAEIKSKRVAKKCGDPALADYIVDKLVIPPKPKASLERSLVLLAKLYHVNLQNTPWGLFLFSCGMWKLKEKQSEKALIEAYFQFSGKPRPGA